MSAGMYLRVLRERQKMTREQLVDRIREHSHDTVKVSDVSLWSIEDGRQEPKGRLLFALIEAVQGNHDDVSRLLLDNSSTVEDARQLAEMRYQQVLNREVGRVVNGFTEDELGRVREELAADPHFLDAIAREVLRKRR